MCPTTCPKCGGDTKVIETRPSASRNRRRRECLQYNHRYSTYEVFANQLTTQEILDELEGALWHSSHFVHHLQRVITSFHPPDKPSQPDQDSGIYLENSGIEI